ncbi:Hypothetical protein LUCI_2406 [Lucifera butyrica]|uniref:Uncharacterized protein n=1 Tax=Lucifera butyrica TaxID=1351585 RepID=A0A498RA51_9FIRM|nr:hypothetical protein [Lucifera butyrica]VBB07162.1 Hypothetical protein LUCI_2406 [Lucifera butyrica]
MVRDIHNYPDAFYILNFILAIDFGLNLTFQKNLLTFEWSQLTIGIIVVFVATYILFTLLANIFFALFEYFLLQLFSPTVESIKDFFKCNNYNTYDKDSKSIFTLRDEALKEESDFKLKIFNEHQIRYNKLASKKQNFLSITFKFMLLLLLDLHFTKTESSMQLMVSHLPPFLYNWAFFALLLLALLWLRELFETDSSEYKINWPK